MANFLVLGDQMVDVYRVLVPTGVCQENNNRPKYARVREFGSPGGAAHVADQLRVFCNRIVNPFYEYCEDDTEVVSRKYRHVAPDGALLFRYDYDVMRNEITHVPVSVKPDAIIVSDYNKGAIGPTTKRLLSEIEDIPILIDCRDPDGYVTSAPNVLFFPNAREYDEGDYSMTSGVICTDGANGASYIYFEDDNYYNAHIRHYPAFRPTDNPVSVVGAGDIVVAAFAHAFVSMKASLSESTAFAMAAAGTAIRKPFTPTVTLQEAFEAYENYCSDHHFDPGSIRPSTSGAASGATPGRD